MDAKRAAAAGVIATASMTALLMVEPSIGLPKIAIGETLSSSEFCRKVKSAATSWLAACGGILNVKLPAFCTATSFLTVFGSANTKPA